VPNRSGQIAAVSNAAGSSLSSPSFCHLMTNSGPVVEMLFRSELLDPNNSLVQIIGQSISIEGATRTLLRIGASQNGMSANLQI
jgi:hypothetical protein